MNNTFPGNSNNGSRTPSPSDTVVYFPTQRIRRRRGRTTFSENVRIRLDTSFRYDPYPDIIAREALARDTGLDEARIQTWFQNKRSRSKRYQENGPMRRRHSSYGTSPSIRDTPLHVTAPIPLTTPLSLTITPPPVYVSTPVQPLLVERGNVCYTPNTMPYRPPQPTSFVPLSPITPFTLPPTMWLHTLQAYMYYTMTERRRLFEATPTTSLNEREVDEPQDLSMKKMTEASPDSSGYTSRESISPLNVID